MNRAVIEGSPYTILAEQGYGSSAEGRDVAGQVIIGYDGDTGTSMHLVFTIEQAEELLRFLPDVIATAFRYRPEPPNLT